MYRRLCQHVHRKEVNSNQFGLDWPPKGVQSDQPLHSILIGLNRNGPDTFSIQANVLNNDFVRAYCSKTDFLNNDF